MRDPTIKTNESAGNEPPVEFDGSKKVISDLSSWLTDGRYADLEIQQLAEEFSFDRFEIYSSRMLILQYSAKERQPKGDITYTNYKGVIIVVLMRDSPDFLKNSKSNRYIHRITKAVTDSGIELESRRKIAFVQLDKALEQFLNETYNRDEDYELLVELAMLKDPNNDKVKQAVMKRDQFNTP